MRANCPGPHIIPSGFIEGRSPYSARVGFIPETLEEGLRDVHWYADRGYLQIKIYNSMNPEWVKPLAAEAHKLGLRTVGHVPAFTTPDRMIEDGYNEVTHINQLMLGWLLAPGEDTRTPLRLTDMARAADLDLADPKVRHTIDLMKAHNTGLDTTAVIVERLMMSRAGQVAEGDAAYLDHVPIGYQRYRKRSFVNFKDDAEKARYDKAFAKVIETLALLHREGIRLWPGTDDATGFTVHRELELYAKLGMTPGEVLRVATFDCDRISVARPVVRQSAAGQAGGLLPGSRRSLQRHQRGPADRAGDEGRGDLLPEGNLRVARYQALRAAAASDTRQSAGGNRKDRGRERVLARPQCLWGGRSRRMRAIEMRADRFDVAGMHGCDGCVR